MRIELDRGSGLPLFRQVSSAVLAAIDSGALAPGARLPAVRALGRELGLDPNTVFKAYAELRRAGVLESRRGRGCFVSAPPDPRVRRAERERLARQLCRELVARARRHDIGVRELVRELLRLMAPPGA